ncbi:MAG: response regulator [Myxococcaceae bacterium]|nr:response regulator [Myxococcaceae bacterium]
MSAEVSCSVLDIFFQRLKREGRPPEILLEGLNVSYADVRKKNARIDWDTFCRFMENVTALWPTEEELADIGESFFQVPAMKPFSLVARMLFDAPAFYQYVFEQQTGVGDQSFTNMIHTIEQLGTRQLRMDLKIRPGFVPCDAFYVVSLGTFRGMPRALGLGPSEVKMTRIDGGARYEVTVPEGGGWLRRVWRAISIPFTAPAMAAELKESMGELQKRFLELSEARSALAVQTERLKIVNRLGRELAAHTDLLGLAEALGRVFGEELSAIGIVVLVSGEAPGEFDELVRSGPCTGSPTREIDLVSGEEQVGRMRVFAEGKDASDPLTLVDDLVPWISIALGNARSFTLLREYRDQLSVKVEKRTRELNAAMQKLEESLEQQREATRLKTEFFDNVSHELRTPLTLILLTLESLQQKEDTLDAVTRQHLDRMERSASRLLRLINELLDLAKIGAGKMRLRYEAIDVPELVSAVLIPFRVLADEKKLGMRIDVQTEVERVHADPEKLDLVFQNLVSNALKFTQEGEVVVAIRQDAFYVYVEVQDTGTGIPPQDLAIIFDRFAQADSQGTRRIGGTGIGLALVKETVELHGGNIRVESEPGKGSKFIVALPRGTQHIREDLRERRTTEVPVHRDRRSDDHVLLRQRRRLSHQRAEELAAVARENAEGTAAPSPNRPLILVVEDEPELRSFIVSTLRELYEVIEAENGERGLAQARAHGPVLIVSDVMMPRMSGLQMLAALRSDPRTVDIPVILLTARQDVEARVHGLSEGANDYLGKPFSPRELIARIDAQLRLRDAAARVAQTERLAVASLLTSGFAHEVRNPLNGLMNALAPLRESLRPGGDPAVAAAMLEIVEESGERIRHLAESLLLMVRTGGNRQTIDLPDSVAAAIRALKWKTPATVSITQTGRVDAQVVGDPAALTQVWINLLDNALRALDESGTIEVRLSQTKTDVVVEVIDSGAGIRPEDLKRLFEPFFSTRSAGEGSGLGLALCRRIVVSHGGQITIDSTVGQGTRVTVRLPITPPQLVTAPVATEESQPPVLARTGT